MRIRNVAKAVLMAMLLVGAVATPAQADQRQGPEAWQPYRATDFVAPAGRYCDFDLGVTAVVDEEEYRVSARYPDGNVRVYEYRGTLVSRFTNLASGESVTRDLSGHAWTEMSPDGQTMTSFVGAGPFSFGFRATDPYERGYYRFDGLHVITLDADGTRHMTVDAGPAENMCTTLG
jgi:hypothetical protein